MGIHKKTCEKIKTLYKSGWAIADLAKRFNLRERTILSICNDD